jgi:uncharacterized membrane protein
MTIAFAIIGAIIGALYESFFSFIAGGTLGYLLGTVLGLREEMSALKKELKLLTSARAEQRQTEIKAVAAPVQTATLTPEPTSPLSVTPAPAQTAGASLYKEAVTEVAPKVLPETASDFAPTPPRAETKPTASHAAIKPVDEPAIIAYLRNYFSGENILARVGVIILFFGVAFLLKYAAERTHVPIELRLMGVALGAIVMLVIGWRLRTKYEDYALVMQGGAIGVLYLTVFSAMRLFDVLPAAYALIILAAVGIFSAILAIAQNARSLAILGICGGFLAPVLTSTGAGNHVVLFSYYALLNAGILAMAWFKAWRLLNVLGFLFTFVIATFWGVTRYSAENFASTEPFLILFFLFYVAIALLYALSQSVEIKNYVDGTLVFGTPMVAFGLQAGMMQQQAMLQIFEYGLSVSAVVLSLFYLTLAKILLARQRDNLRLLLESFIALGIVFATLAIPLALDGRWTAGAWALEGAAVVWMGVRQNRMLARLFGSALQIAAGLALLDDYHYHTTPYAILNSVYIGGALISVAGLFSAWFMQRSSSLLKQFERPVANVLFAWGTLWWLGSGLREIEHFIQYKQVFAMSILFVAGSSVAYSLLHTRLNWRVARIPALGLLPLLWLMAYVQWYWVAHPFAGSGYVAWPFAFLMLYWILRREETQLSASLTRAWHMGALWLFTMLASKEAAWAINDGVQGQGTWPLIAWALVPGLILGALSLRGQQIRWPVAAHLQTYLGVAAAPLAIFILLWSLFSNFNSDGNPYPLSYLPLLNPLDLAQIFVFLVLGSWLLKIRALQITTFDEVPREARYALIAIPLFVWLNAALLRTLHYWADVPFNLHSMMHSVLVQASLSIFWSVLAMGLMRLAAQKQIRTLWMAGGVLMAAVVIKLFTVDISSSGSLERIVSFIGVAVLMLIIAYIAPLPAKQPENKQHV